MITRENISSHELIGTRAQIVQSTNQEIVGITGKIVDETKFMFALDTGKAIKRFPKGISVWKFSFVNGEAEIDGTKLTKRSYERMGVRA
ncbi:MAG TPA: ribonuclease P protein subunit [Candidatus Nitrosotalea sp.]|nr:ribonuclease P protein subunit [Candidatus Nitrosotalea sp.]